VISTTSRAGGIALTISQISKGERDLHCRIIDHAAVLFQPNPEIKANLPDAVTPGT